MQWTMKRLWALLLVPVAAWAVEETLSVTQEAPAVEAQSALPATASPAAESAPAVPATDAAVAATPAFVAEPAEYAGMISSHNQWRRAIGTPDLRWSAAAAQMAQGWANQLGAENCAVRHNPDPERKKKYGENIYFYWRTGPYEGYARDAPYIVDAWGVERELYDEANNTCFISEGKTCRHYTQLVWTYSEEVGCGRARCGLGEVWVCNYTPRGNFIQVRPYELADKPPGNGYPAFSAPGGTVLASRGLPEPPRLEPGESEGSPALPDMAE